MSATGEHPETPRSPFGAQRGLTEWLPLRMAEMAPAVLLVGDLMLDGWWDGTIERLCREAPAPVVDIRLRTWAPGGAANTAMNLAALGARVKLAGAVGLMPPGRAPAAAEGGRGRRRLRSAAPGDGDDDEDPDQQRRAVAAAARRRRRPGDPRPRWTASPPPSLEASAILTP